MTFQDTTTVLSEANLALVAELRTTREFIKTLKAREEEVRGILLVELKDAEQGITASGVPMIAVDRQSRSRVDGNRLHALYPDIWDDCQIATEVQALRFVEEPGTI